MKKDVLGLARKIPVYQNIRGIFEDPDPVSEEFWSRIKYFEFSDRRRILERYFEAERRMPALTFIYSLNPAGNGESMGIIAPVDLEGKDTIPLRGKRIRGFVFDAQSSFTARGRTFRLSLPRMDDAFFTAGSTVKDKDYTDGIVEVLENPHLFEREGDLWVTHYICPSPGFLSERYPDLYTEIVLERIKTITK